MKIDILKTLNASNRIHKHEYIIFRFAKRKTSWKMKKTIKEQNFFMYIFVVKEFGGFQTANTRSQTWYFIDR